LQEDYRLNAQGFNGWKILDEPSDALQSLVMCDGQYMILCLFDLQEKKKEITNVVFLVMIHKDFYV
jgi:hypothetical protein